MSNDKSQETQTDKTGSRTKGKQSSRGNSQGSPKNTGKKPQKSKNQQNRKKKTQEESPRDSRPPKGETASSRRKKSSGGQKSSGDRKRETPSKKNTGSRSKTESRQGSSGSKPSGGSRSSGNSKSFGNSREKVTGKLQINSKGFGFVRLDDRPDIFIHYDNLANAMDGDTVEAGILQGGQKPSGRILRVTERSGRNILGVYRQGQGRDKGGKVYPEDNRLPTSLIIPAGEIEKAGLEKKLKGGQIVVAQLLNWSDPSSKPTGTITEIVGAQDEPGIDLKTVALSRGLPVEYPRNLAREAQKIQEPKIRRELKNREDLRKLDCFTIDPDTAKDYDDAVSLRQLPSGLLELGVHIADVSHYVPEGSALDEEAWKRATSVYLVQQVLPMLPEHLSNNVCSLVPRKPRLAFTVFMEFNSRGELQGKRITPSVIESKERFTYHDVEAIIQGKKHRYAPAIHQMQMLSQILRLRREEKGSIDFDLSEPIIDLDEEGIPRTIEPKERLDAHRLVEEFMLAANKTVAEFVISEEKKRKKPLPFVYRNHEKPPEEDVQGFLSAVTGMGIPYKSDGPVGPDDYRNILGIVENMEFKDFLEKIALQSMTKAVYSTENKGHFGLAFDAYTHFTSPIRRYPDLVIHRLLKRYIGKETRAEKSGKPNLKYLEKTCHNSTEKEKTAVAAEREYLKIKSLQFLANKVGRVYSGVVSGVTSFGVFVELSRYLTEGLIPLTALKDDYYTYDAENYQYTGRDTGNTIRLGDRVRVKVDRVSVDDRKADFSLVTKK